MAINQSIGGYGSGPATGAGVVADHRGGDRAPEIRCQGNAEVVLRKTADDAAGVRAERAAQRHNACVFRGIDAVVAGNGVQAHRRVGHGEVQGGGTIEACIGVTGRIQQRARINFDVVGLGHQQVGSRVDGEGVAINRYIAAGDVDGDCGGVRVIDEADVATAFLHFLGEGEAQVGSRCVYATIGRSAAGECRGGGVDQVAAVVCNRCMGQGCVVACTIFDGAVVQAEAISRNADAIVVGLLGYNGVLEHQGCAAAARGVVGLHGRAADVECQLRRARDGDGFAQGDGDAEDVTCIQQTVLGAGC